MWTIDKRAAVRDTTAFVAPETVDLLGEKMIGIIADRRVTKVHRYLGRNGGVPDVFPGLRVWHGGFGGPTTQRPRESAGVRLASSNRFFEGLGFSIGPHPETEQQIRDRYHNPERQFLGQRRDITLVELIGWPGSPGRDDKIRVEYWNSNGVGQESILAFDDLDPVQEIAWNLTDDQIRQVYMDDEWCTFHRLHFEDADHNYQPGPCTLRSATLAENLAMLAHRAADKEANEDA